MLEIELEANRDWHLFTLGTDAAVDRPLLSEAVGERAKLGDGLGQLEVAMLAERHDEAADLALLLDQQPLELVQVILDLSARARRALDRLDPEGGARQELDDAVVDVSGERQAGTHGSPGFDRIEESIAVEG